MASAAITRRGREIALDSQTTAPVAGPSTMMLVRTGHDFRDDYETLSAVVGDEITATNYARVVATFQAVVTQPDNRVTRQIDDTLFALLGGAVNDTVAGCYLFHDSGDPATSPLVACVPFVTEQTTDGTDLTIVWPLETMTQLPPLI